MNILTRIDCFLIPRRLNYALITGAILWIVWLLSIIGGVGNTDLAGQIIGTDYIQFYAAGKSILLNQTDRLYDFGYQKQLQETTNGISLSSPFLFLTPPFLAWLYAPFSLFPYQVSFTLWSLFSLLLLWLCIGWLGVDNRKPKFLWALTFFPVFASISFGQNSLLSLAILSLTFMLWRKDRGWLAGFVLSFLFYKPQLASGVLLLWLLEWRRDWKALLGTALGCGILAILSFTFLPQASLVYIEIAQNFIPKMMEIEGFPLWHAHTLRAFWLLLFPKTPLLSEVFSLIISIIGLILFIGFWKSNRKSLELLYAGAIALTILISPHAMIYDWVLLLIPATLIWDANPEYKHFLRPAYAIIWCVSIMSGSISHLEYQWFAHAFQISVPIFIYILYKFFRVI